VRRVALQALLAAAALLAGCSGASDEPVDDTPEAIVRPTTFVVDAQPGDDVRIEPDRLVFRREGHTDLLTRHPGDVVASGAGFLRRVVTIREDGDTIVLDTAPASIEDAIEQGRVRQHVLADPAGTLAPQGLTDGAVKLAVPATHLSLGSHGAIDVVQGELDYKPDLDLDLLVRHGSIERLKVVAGGAASASMRVRFDLHKDASVASGFWLRLGGPGIEIASLPPIHAIVWVGVVPVVVAVRMQLLLGYTFDVSGDARGELALDLGAAVRAGLSRENGEWQTIGASSFQVAPHGTVESPANLVVGDVTLTARVAVSFYELAGPYVGLQAYAGVGHQRTTAGEDWFGELGIRAIAGVEVGLFGKSAAGYQVDAFDRGVRIPLGSP
jgi:hypothetical protein